MGLEASYVEAIKTALTLKGFIVKKVGQHRADLGGSDPGVPDLIVIAPWNKVWGICRNLLFEVKVPEGPLTGKGGKRSSEQQNLERLGAVVVVDDPIKAVEIAEFHLGRRPI